MGTRIDFDRPQGPGDDFAKSTRELRAEGRKTFSFCQREEVRAVIVRPSGPEEGPRGSREALAIASLTAIRQV